MATSSNKPANITELGPLGYRQLQRANELSQAGTVPDMSDHFAKWGINENDKSLYDPLEHAQQDVPNPFGSQKTRLGDQDYWGNSVFDENTATEEQFSRLGDIRAENQPWYSKLINGVGKAGITAATTALEFGGLIYGLGQGAYNAAAFNEHNDKEGEGNRMGAFLHGLWYNPITRALQTINEASEDIMPNYYTRDEMENPFSNIFTANFIGDKIIKNLGFMVGAFYGGLPFAKAISKIGTRGVKAAREVKGAEELGMQAAVNDVRAAAGTDTAMADRLISAKHLTEAERGERMRKGLENINNVANTTRATTQLIGALGSAINEGAIEAINNSKDWADTKTAEENQRYEQMLDSIYRRYGNSPTAENLMSRAEDDHNRRLAEIQEGRAAMGNADLLMNIPILTYSNLIQFGKLYTRGFDTTRRKMGSFWNKHKLPGNTTDKAFESTKTWKGGLARGVRNSLMEGTEEYLQRVASDTSGNSVESSINRYLQFGNNENAELETQDFVAGFSKAIAENIGNPQAWEEFMIGALSSTLGMPVFGSQTKNAYMKLGPVGFAGGVKGHYDDYMKEKEREEEIAKYLNKRVRGEDSEKFRNLYDYLRKSGDYEKALQTALENNDKEEFKNLEAEKLFEDINAFASSGHLEEFKQLIGYNKDYTDEELADIVQITSKPVSAKEHMDRDRKRLEEVDKAITTIGDLSKLEEDYANADNELAQASYDLAELKKNRQTETGSEKIKTLDESIKEKEEEVEQLSASKYALAYKLEHKSQYEGSLKQLKDERGELENKLADASNYKDTDEGEFYQMVNGVPRGMNLMQDVDENGNPIEGTEGNEMRRILERNRQKLLKGINDYLRIRDYIDVESDGRLKDDQISILTKMRMQILDKEARSIEMVTDLAKGLKPVMDEYAKDKKEIEDINKRVEEKYNVAVKNLEDAKATKDPEVIAKAEEQLADMEFEKASAKYALSQATNGYENLRMIAASHSVTPEEAKALNRGYGKDEDGKTYTDKYGNDRTITLDEAMNILRYDTNYDSLRTLVWANKSLSRNEQDRFSRELESLKQLSKDREEYNEKFRKFIGDPTLLNKAINDSEIRMSEKEKDNKSDQLALKLRRARDFSEMDRIIKGSKLAPEVLDSAIAKAKQDGDAAFKNMLSDYEKANGMRNAVLNNLQQAPSVIKDALMQNVSYAWEEALIDSTEDSRATVFMDNLKKLMEEADIAGSTEQAKALKEAINSVESAAASSATNSSSSVRSASTSTAATGNNNNSGSASSSSSNKGPTKEAVLKHLKNALNVALRKNATISSLDDLEKVNGTRTQVQNIKAYNAVHPEDQITDEFIAQKYNELKGTDDGGENTFSDDVSINDSGDTEEGSVRETDYDDSKSATMQKRQRIFFRGTGITEFSIYDDAREKRPAEGKEDYELKGAGAWIRNILKATGAYEFLKHNYLGYLNQSRSDKEGEIKIHLLRMKDTSDDKTLGDTVFLAIEWDRNTPVKINKTGLGGTTEITIPDTSISAVDKNGTVKNYQIIGDMSVLDDADSAVSRAFNSITEAVKNELDPILDNLDSSRTNSDDALDKWAVSEHTTTLAEIYTGRLVKRAGGLTADDKIGLDTLIEESDEWKGEKVDFIFGVVTSPGKVSGMNKVDIGTPTTNFPIIYPNSAWIQKDKSKGAILMFVPKPDGQLYPIRCTRRTVDEWLNDSNGDRLKNALSGRVKNEYVDLMVSTLRTLFNPKSSVGERTQAREHLRDFFVMGSGGKKTSVYFDKDTVRVNFGEAATDKHTISIDENDIDKAVTEFFELLKAQAIPFSIPIPSTRTFSGRALVSAGIFKIGIKDFYNFNPSFVVRPIDKDGMVKPEVPEEVMDWFTGNKNIRREGITITTNDGKIKYIKDSSGTVPVYYKSKLDDHGHVTTVEEVKGDSEEYVLIAGADTVKEKGELAIYTLLEKAGVEEKQRKAYESVIGSKWKNVYVLRSGSNLWFYDERSSSHNIRRLFKYDESEGSLYKELQDAFDADVKRNEGNVLKVLTKDAAPSKKSFLDDAKEAEKGTTESIISKLENSAKTGKNGADKSKARKINWEALKKELQNITVEGFIPQDQVYSLIEDVFTKYNAAEFLKNIGAYTGEGAASTYLIEAVLAQKKPVQSSSTKQASTKLELEDIAKNKVQVGDEVVEWWPEENKSAYLYDDGEPIVGIVTYIDTDGTPLVEFPLKGKKLMTDANMHGHTLKRVKKPATKNGPVKGGEAPSNLLLESKNGESRLDTFIRLAKTKDRIEVVDVLAEGVRLSNGKTDISFWNEEVENEGGKLSRLELLFEALQILEANDKLKEGTESYNDLIDELIELCKLAACSQKDSKDLFENFISKVC